MSFFQKCRLCHDLYCVIFLTLSAQVNLLLKHFLFTLEYKINLVETSVSHDLLKIPLRMGKVVYPLDFYNIGWSAASGDFPIVSYTNES